MHHMFLENVFHNNPLHHQIQQYYQLLEILLLKCVWVEDKWGNAVAGATIGHKTFLMRHEYNASGDHAKVTKVDNWQQIYYYIN